MLEMKDDEAAFKDTVAHEYAHLIFENASRRAGSTKTEDAIIPFWPKSVYEGVADLVASLALGTSQLGSKKIWSTRNIHEFATLDEAKKSKALTLSKARKAFRFYGLIPKYPIYEDWLNRVNQFIEASGGADPYAEGLWLAGALESKSIGMVKKRSLMRILITHAKSGDQVSNTQLFYDILVKELHN
jgi:hypothetical protein